MMIITYISRDMNSCNIIAPCNHEKHRQHFKPQLGGSSARQLPVAGAARHVAARQSTTEPGSAPVACAEGVGGNEGNGGGYRVGNEQVGRGICIRSLYNLIL